ncbi:MAG TPA: DegT/DnrJ/EryC1/StrS family aminotransferase [Bryobacteraceae bacterium]|nr:DegT/DnrJ/EryC1/StrS family aminotransferase [Bryobacteraceae bacterium]
MVNRRNFMAGTASAALAAEGGKPVRSKPLVATHWGTQYYDEREREQIAQVLETRNPFRYYGHGAEPPAKASTFEKEFAARMKARFALAVATGTGALDAAMAALQIGPGDEVILPAWTFVSCYNTIVLAGALPVFAEVDESFHLDPADVESRITPQTKLIMAVHLRGNPCDMDPIMAIARKRGIKVLEDAAQSMGASYKGRPVGTIGDMGMFSLQITKPIAAGEGGILATNDPALYERAVRYHDVGGVRPWHESVLGKTTLEPFPGTNLRINELTAAVALAQLRKLDRIIGDVRANSRRVYAGINDLPGIRFRKRPDPAGDLDSIIFIRFDNSERTNRFIAAMKAEGVPVTRPGSAAMLPTVPFIAKKVSPRPNWPTFTTGRGPSIRYGAEICPRSIDIVSRFAGPPIDPKYTKADTDDIVAAIRKAYPAAIA